MQARHIAATLMAVALAGGAVTAADAAPKPKKPKPISGSKKISDPVPDATGSHPDSGEGCDSMLPPQAQTDSPVSLKIPARGRLNVSIDNKLDWALEVRDSKGTTIVGKDGGLPTDVETLSVTIKKPGTYKLYACNLGGEPEVTMTYRWTPS